MEKNEKVQCLLYGAERSVYLSPLVDRSYLQEIPYEIVGRRRGDVDSLYASCDKAEKVHIYMHYVFMYSHLSNYILHVYLPSFPSIANCPVFPTCLLSSFPNLSTV